MNSSRYLLRRWIPLLLLIPLSYLFKPIFWEPLDYRFFNFFQAKRQVPPWQEVIVVGIDEPTLEESFNRPIYPLSGHEEQHTRVTECLAKAGAKAIVFDIELSELVLKDPPAELAKAFYEAGNVYLVKYVNMVRHLMRENVEIIRVKEYNPHELLLLASKGAYIANVELDKDGRFRRYTPFRIIAGIRYDGLPAVLADYRSASSVPIDLPSVDNPVPIISYKNVLSENLAECARIKDKIVFIGSILPTAYDYVTVSRLTEFPEGHRSRNLPGVVTLAVITENLLRGPEVRDGGLPLELLWILLWCFLVVTLMPRMHPVVTAAVFIGVSVVALVVTGLFHVYLGIIFPAGFLLGTLFVCGVFTMIVLNIQTIKELYAEEAEIERVRKEMDTARQIQLAFLPAEIPQYEELDIWAANISSLEVSGDYYDILEGTDGDSLIVAIADVSGKGLPAALIMSNVQAGLHSQLFLGTHDIVDITHNLNRLIYENTPSTRFVTFLVAEIFQDPLRLRYVRAGHESPLHASSNGVFHKLEKGGIALGVLPDAKYSAEEILLGSGDVVCLYTDGITDALNTDEEEFGLDRLIAVLEESHLKGAREIVNAVLNAIRDFSRSMKQQDDITFVIIKGK